MIYHGTHFYAVHSRDVGTFGGKAKNATVKIYRSHDVGTRACTLVGPAQIEEFKGLIAECGEDRAARDAIMAEYVKCGEEE